MQDKERKMNYTFPLRPSVKFLLEKISRTKNISMSQVLETIIIEKAKRLKVE